MMSDVNILACGGKRYIGIRNGYGKFIGTLEFKPSKDQVKRIRLYKSILLETEDKEECHKLNRKLIDLTKQISKEMLLYFPKKIKEISKKRGCRVYPIKKGVRFQNGTTRKNNYY